MKHHPVLLSPEIFSEVVSGAAKEISVLPWLLLRPGDRLVLREKGTSRTLRVTVTGASFGHPAADRSAAQFARFDPSSAVLTDGPP